MDGEPRWQASASDKSRRDKSAPYETVWPLWFALFERHRPLAVGPTFTRPPSPASAGTLPHIAQSPMINLS